MRTKLCLYILICIIAVINAGCNKSEHGGSDASMPAEKSGMQTNEIRSIADLRKILIPGMPTNEIISRFGQPWFADTTGEGKMFWIYELVPFPADDKMIGTDVTGITVGITNGHMAKWGCNYTSKSPDSKELSMGEGKNNEGIRDSNATGNKIELFVVSNDPITNGQFIDTKRFPKLGFISQTADLTINKIANVILRENTPNQPENKRNIYWSFGIFLTPDDAKRLEILSRDNISKKILMVVGGDPVSAPRVMGELTTGSFEIVCSEQTLMESVKTKLNNIEKQNQ